MNQNTWWILVEAQSLIVNSLNPKDIQNANLKLLKEH